MKHDKTAPTATVKTGGKTDGIQDNARPDDGRSDSEAGKESSQPERCLQAIQSLAGLRDSQEYYAKEAAVLKQFASDSDLLRDRKAFSQPYSLQTDKIGKISGAEH